MNKGLNESYNFDENKVKENANFFTSTIADRVKYIIDEDSLWQEEYLKLFDTAQQGKHTEEVFLQFIQHWNDTICKAVAFNPNNKFPDILDKLSYHECEDVRVMVALRHYTPIETLKRLYKEDVDEYVRNTAFETITNSRVFFEALSKKIDINKLIEEL